MTDKEVKLLVVDDLEMIREGVAFYLKKKGYTVFTAKSAEWALPIIIEEQLDFIITDTCLPGLSGLDFIRLIRKINGTVKIIIVSSYIPNQYEEPRLQEYNIWEYMTKPLVLDNLESVVKRALEFTKEG